MFVSKSIPAKHSLLKFAAITSTLERIYFMASISTLTNLLNAIFLLRKVGKRLKYTMHCDYTHSISKINIKKKGKTKIYITMDRYSSNAMGVCR